MTDIAVKTEARMLPHTITLVVIGLAAMAIAAVLTFVANDITTRTWDEVDDDAMVAALTAWTDVAVTAGIAALVGAVVLGGVAEVARRVVREVAQATDAPRD
jgi:divalent metal cation (Fe/Co/Zn/Cd) transporter